MSTTERAAPRVPRGLERAGKRLWKDLTETFEFGPHEIPLLLAAARGADRLERLAAVEAGLDDLFVHHAQHGLKPHPVIVESRLAAQSLARLLASLHIPSDEGTGAGRGAHRSPRVLSVVSDDEDVV